MKISYLKGLLYLLSTLCYCACQSLEDKEIEAALELAQNNRKELELVLSHFGAHKDDKLKLKAARFLIANMPGHKSYQGKRLDYYKSLIYKEPKPISKTTFSDLWKYAKDSIKSSDSAINNFLYFFSLLQTSEHKLS